MMKTCAVLILLFLSFTGCKRQTPSDILANGATNLVSAVTLAPITNMVLIKAGSFTRGKNTVTLTQDFWIGKYEVTQAEYVNLLGTNPSKFTEEGTNRPVEKVTQLDAIRYCSELTRREREGGRLPSGFQYRLPTEAEWEYACRAGSTNLYSFGEDAGMADQFAWTAENGEGKTHPVGQKKPNAWGLFDMHGNVWEWCSDWFGLFPTGELTDPVGPAEGKYKVFKGGSWNHDVEMARCANRFMMAAGNGINFVGFRVVLGK